jgi:uncharacterized protein (DUF58 family)
VLTRTGLAVSVASVILTALGLRFAYTELVVIGAVGLVLVLIGLATVRRAPAVNGTRRSYAHRVPRGEHLEVLFDLEATGSHAVAPVVLLDSLAGELVEVPVPGLAVGSTITLRYELRARRRGVHRLGPVAVRRSDLLSLMVGERRLGQQVDVIVHPKVWNLGGSSGVDRNTDIEVTLRRASSDPLAGFQSLREYVRGDDTRTIHWPTTARVGRPMVREFMDPRRPVFTIVLVTERASYTEADFEEAIDVAASLATHVLRRGIDIVLRTTDRRHLGLPHPVRDEIQLLDLLARVRRTEVEETELVSHVMMFGWEESVAIVICGPTSRALVEVRELGDRVVPIRVGADVGRAPVIPGRSFSATTAEAFAAQWTDVVR